MKRFSKQKNSSSSCTVYKHDKHLKPGCNISVIFLLSEPGATSADSQSAKLKRAKLNSVHCRRHHHHMYKRNGYSRMGCWRGGCDSPTRRVWGNQHFYDICLNISFMKNTFTHKITNASPEMITLVVNCCMFYCECINKLKANCTFPFWNTIPYSANKWFKNKSHSCREFHLNKLCRYRKIFPKFTPIITFPCSLRGWNCMLHSHTPFIIPFPVIPRSINQTCQHSISLILTVEELKCFYERLIQRLEAAREDWPGPC